MLPADSASSSVIFTLNPASKTDTPISTSSPAFTSSYIIPASLSSGISSLTLYRVPPFPNPPASEPSFTIYHKSDYLVSSKMRAVIEGTSVKTVSGERARLEISEHSGEIYDYTVDQRRLARKFSYKTGDGELEALEVFHIEDISRARLELLLSVWIRNLWLRYRPARSGKRKIWSACKNRLRFDRSNKGVPVKEPWMFNKY